MPITGRHPAAAIRSVITLALMSGLLATGAVGCSALGWQDLAAPPATPDAPPAPTIVAPTPAVGAAAGPLYQVGGASFAVAVRDGVAYLGMGPRVIALDVADPTAPRAIAQSPVLGGVVRGLVLDERNALWAAAEEGGVYVLGTDTTGGELAVVAQAATPARAQDVALVGPRAYVAYEPVGVVVLERDETAALREVGRFEEPSPNPPEAWWPPEGVYVSVAADKALVYFVSSVYGVLVLDATDVANIRKVFELPQPDARDVDVTQGVVLLSNTWFAIDATNPANPVELELPAQVDAGEYGLAVGNGVLVTRHAVYDVSDPRRPRKVTEPADSRADGFGRPTLAGDFVYLPRGERGSGLDIWRLSSGVAERVGAFEGLSTWDVSAHAVGDRLVLDAAVGDQVLALDASDPARLSAEYVPVETLDRSVWLNRQRVLLRGDRAFVPGYARLQVFDVAAPERAVGGTGLAGDAWNLVPAGDLLYALDSGMDGDMAKEGPRYLEIVDASRPDQPRVLGRTSFDDPLVAAAIGDGVAVALSGFGTLGYHPAFEPAHLAVVDVRDPAHPQRIGGLRLDQAAESVLLDGQTAHVAVGTGWRAVDISQPDKPRMVDSRPLPGQPYSIANVGDVLWFATLRAGLVGLPLSAATGTESALPQPMPTPPPDVRGEPFGPRYGEAP